MHLVVESYGLLQWEDPADIEAVHCARTPM